MKIALLGYGKMGHIIEKIAQDRKHEIVLKIDVDNQHELTAENLQKADVAIEFSTPATVLEHIEACFEAKVPVIVGTTGWYGHLQRLKDECEQNGSTMLYASNFSVGVNVFFHVNKVLARLMNNYPYYDVQVEEIHHIHKLDKPSGTAITIAEQILERIDRKNKWSIEEKSSDTLFIKDIREGEVPGTHIIKYTSAVDDIEIMHKAHNRQGFALGSVVAAEYLYGKKGIFTMQDLI